MNMLDFHTPITFKGQSGKIVGRTREGIPRYDIMLEDRRIIHSLPPEVFEVI